MDQEKVHNVFYDNGFFVKLTAQGNEEYSINFYDSLIRYIPSLHNGLYTTYFTWSSLLEAIGLGNLREKGQKLDLSEFHIRRNDQNIEKKLDAAYHHAHQYFLHHPELSIDSLLDAIQTQIDLSTSKATIKLVEDTLGRYKKSIVSAPNDRKESLAQHLAWDAVCECPFANFNQLKDEDQVRVRKKTRQINEWLLRIFHDKQAQGIDLSSYRLADKIQKELLSSDEYFELFQHREKRGASKICVPHLLENRKDLSDADAIHFATFGYENRAGIVFTTDKPEVIKQRLIIQLSVMRFLCTAEKSKLNLLPGIVLFIDSETCVVYDKLDVSELNEEAGINIHIEDLKNNRKRSLVTF